MFSKIFGNLKSKGSPTKHVGGSNDIEGSRSGKKLSERQPYHRPKFVRLSEEDEKVFDSHDLRIIFASSDDPQYRVASSAGYAECINAGKSTRNEDQATAGTFVLNSMATNGDGKMVEREREPIDVSYFCIFDGHAGTGAAMMASTDLVHCLQEKLEVVKDYLVTLNEDDMFSNSCNLYDVTVDSLVKGAIEEAFLTFDDQIAKERQIFNVNGGCTCILCLVMLDRVYLAHAGDCRAVAYIGDKIVELSQEFTPETDAKRIQALAHANPSLTHGIFSANCYHRPLVKKDIGSRMFYKGPLSAGWFCKTVEKEDVESPPLVAGRGKWARLMGVIGVTKGFGDHDLTVPSTNLVVKPFMSAMPEIRVLNLCGEDFQEEDVLVMGCDGLWDFTSNQSMQTTVRAAMAQSREDNNNGDISYIAAAREVVRFARGDNHGRGWKMADGRDASFDDICAFVIPLGRLRDHDKSGKAVAVDNKEEEESSATRDESVAPTSCGDNDAKVEVNQPGRDTDTGESLENGQNGDTHVDSSSGSVSAETPTNGHADTEESSRTANGSSEVQAAEATGNGKAEAADHGDDDDGETNGHTDSIEATEASGDGETNGKSDETNGKSDETNGKSDETNGKSDETSEMTESEGVATSSL